MSVLFGSNVAQLATAGQVQPAQQVDGLSRFETDYGWGESHSEPQSAVSNPAPSPAGQPSFAQRTVQPVASHPPPAPLARPVNLPLPSPVSTASNGQHQIQPVVARSAASTHAVPTIVPQANLVRPAQPVQQIAQPQPTIRPVNRNMPPMPSATAQPVAPPIVLPAQPPSIERSFEPQQPISQQPSIAQPVPSQAAPVQPLAPTVNRATSNQPASPIQPIQPAPAAERQNSAVEPKGSTVDRAQQERMGQMAVHNPDMVKVPKHLNATQVWNGLSRINQFHADREADEDTRSPWERKVVETKPERPKKVLRRTAIEEVGSTKKKRSEPRPVQREVTASQLEQSSQAPKTINSDPEPVVAQDNTPSLEEVWPVQRLEEPSDFGNPDGLDADLVNLDPPSRPTLNREEQTNAAEIESVVNRVESAQQSDSSIDFVPPTRPRPQIVRRSKAEPSQPAPPTEGVHVDSDPVQREPFGVQTEFGELPSDLWQLVGDQPPAKAEPAAQRAIEPDVAPSAAESLDAPQAPASQPVARSIEPSQPVESQPQSEPFQASDIASEPISQTQNNQVVAPPLARDSVEAAGAIPTVDQPIQPKSEPTGHHVEPLTAPATPSAEASPINRVEATPEGDEPFDEVAPINRATEERPPSEPVQQPALEPASFRPVMRAEPDFAEIDDIATDDGGSVEEPSPEPESLDSTSESITDLANGAEPKGAMIFADPETAEADGGQAAPVEVNMPQLEQPATLFGDPDEVTQVAAEAEPKSAGESVTLFADEEQAAEKIDTPVPVSIQSEAEESEPQQAYGDEAQVSSITAAGDSGEKEGGLTLYPDDDAVTGSAIELKIKVSGEEELLIGFADSNQLSQFIDVAAASDQPPGLMLFPAEDGDGEGEFDPVPFLLQRQGEQDLVIGFADEATLDAFLSEASAVERGSTALIYAEQEPADEDLENPVEVHFRSADGNDVLLGYADSEALEDLIQAADEVNPENDLNELTQLVYGRLRHQLQVENERRGISS